MDTHIHNVVHMQIFSTCTCEYMHMQILSTYEYMHINADYMSAVVLKNSATAKVRTSFTGRTQSNQRHSDVGLVSLL